MRKLVIVGCSWGCGEWSNSKGNSLSVSHPGLTEYLSQDNPVTNLSRSGASNWQSCFSLRNYLEYHVDSQNQPTIFVLQTDAARSAVSNKYDIDYKSVILTSTGLKDYYTTLTEIFYIKLNELANQFGVKIHMIGGLTDLDLEVMSLYTNLIPCCVSWIKLLDHTHIPSVIPMIQGTDHFVLAKKHNRLDLVEDIMNHSDQTFLQAQGLMETEYFGPAFGDFHPSRNGHKVLADYIKHYLKELQ